MSQQVLSRTKLFEPDTRVITNETNVAAVTSEKTEYKDGALKALEDDSSVVSTKGRDIAEAIEIIETKEKVATARAATNSVDHIRTYSSLLIDTLTDPIPRTKMEVAGKIAIDPKAEVVDAQADDDFRRAEAGTSINAENPLVRSSIKVNDKKSWCIMM